MLTLEKKKRSGEVYITLKAKQGFFSLAFQKALLWALGFHFAAVLLFHITPFRLTSGRILPPAFVESDSAENEGGILTNLESEWSSRRYLLTPKLSSPEIPQILKPAFLEWSDLNHEKTENTVAFLALEKTSRENELFGVIDKKEPLAETSRVLVNLNGSLANRKVVWADVARSHLESCVRTFCRYTYHIQVDDRSGQIFWYEPVNSKPKRSYRDENIDEKIGVEDFLKHLEFEKKPHGFVTSGDLEIVVLEREN